MTAGQAIEQADELRPNNQFTDSLKQKLAAPVRCPGMQHEHCAAQPDGGL